MHASTPGFARVAATVVLSRAAQPVSRAVTPGGRLNASNMPSAGPKVFAADVAVRPTAAHAAPPCAEFETGRHQQKNATSRQRYARRRAKRICTDCGEPSQGASRCPACARRSYMRSGEHRGLPISPPSYTVIEIATGEDHGTYDNWAEVAACLAFARLSYEEVEVLSDVSIMANYTSW